MQTGKAITNQLLAQVYYPRYHKTQFFFITGLVGSLLQDRMTLRRLQEEI